eukprot:CAMPEP_0206139398 /NCGR_PEP_ID=MMETSP1473-20131121/5824_1 /ASSEMBLY_ACC=CAM_ASM_001109 /TAXON_ID=1461547 /ORGANISM="Stichococcus sp, Strain RCC1054" /LENGTH=136 /DNA_ID=CAMNT_0053533175 /DNA_START=62 /DNA_END=472 /DNA_ORIENTATION=+
MALSMKVSTSSAVACRPMRTTALRSPVQVPLRTTRSVAVKGYGKESQYFDLDDLENTVGSWEMYGVEDDKRYPNLQAEFFERAAGPLTRREAIYSFLAVSFAGAILVWGGKGSKDARLPITQGPQKPAVVGPRGRI